MPLPPTAFNTSSGDSAVFLTSFLRNTVGHVLIAWLRYFDSDEDGDGQVSLEEFTTAMRRLNFKGDAEVIFRQIDADDSGFLTLYEVDGKCADLWAAFRAWCAETFSSTEDMVVQLRGSLVELSPPENDRNDRRSFRKSKSAVPPAESTFIREQFLENAPRHGWFGGFEDAIFTSLDRRKTGYVIQADLPWFEKARSQHNRRMQMRPAGNRSALVNTAPGAAAKKNPMQALLAFMSFLRSCSMGGTLMQTWRGLLDPDGCLYVQKADVQRACAQVGWRGDVSILWSALDAPNGRAALEEFGFKEARALAMFRSWAMAAAGGLEEAWQRLLGVERGFQRRRRGSVVMAQAPSIDTLDRQAFVFAVGRIQAPGKAKVEDPDYLFSILDWEPNGKLQYKDLRFLEYWEPVKWLCEQPDAQVAASFKETVLSKYGNHPVKAWRLCLDMDGTGICRWVAFNQACDRIQWKGNCAKAWLGLDKQSLGFITLHNIDAEVAENLALFRRWCFATYGGVAIAFHALDADGSGSLSEEEFVTVIQNSSFKGDAMAAWNALNLEGSDILSEREMDFLDDMELDMLAAYVSATEASEQLEAEKHQVEVDPTRRSSTVVTDLRRHSILSQAQGSDATALLLSTPESRMELMEIMGLNDEVDSESMFSVTLPSLTETKSTKWNDLPKAVPSEEKAVRCPTRGTLYVGGIPYM